jgi:dolichol-phosphate mannosyltransferase
MRVCIIIPTYNEAGNIERLMAEIERACAANDIHILVVDDHSPDGTGQLVEAVAAGNPRVGIIHRTGKLGLGTAYVAGFQYALTNHFDGAITMDADFSHHPQYLPALIQGLESFDIMIGSRYIPGGGVENWGWLRRLMSFGANLFSRVVLGLKAHDCSSGLRCYRTQVLAALDFGQFESFGYSFLEEMLYRCQKKGFSAGETPIIFRNRVAGSSKINGREVVTALLLLLKVRLRL